MRSFSRLSLPERLLLLREISGLCDEEETFLKGGGLPDKGLSDLLIENAVGYYALPLGIVSDVVVNHRTYTVPLVTEETSVIAALQKTVRWIEKQRGQVTAESLPPQEMIGQIHIPKIKNISRLKDLLSSKKQFLIEQAHKGPACMMAARGGGIRDILFRQLPRPDGDHMGVIHVHVDVQEAMGANLINQICEFLKHLIAAETEETLGMAVLSNLSDLRRVRVQVSVPGVSSCMGEALEEASLFAQLDPYRAATHNKGLLNGIDGVAVATGNDWRALEAALHSYAARDGTYRGLSTWVFKEGTLNGFLEAPFPVGCVGGITNSHPGARLSFKILGISKAQELAQVMASIGLLQNLGALRALVTVGIVQGHMALHIDNLLLSAGASPLESKNLKKELHQGLKSKGYISSPEILKLLQKERTDD